MAECGTTAGYFAHRSANEDQCDRCREAWRSYFRARRNLKRYPIVCLECGAEAMVDRRCRKYCSQQCGSTAAGRKGRQVKRAANPRPVVLYVGPPFERVAPPIVHVKTSRRITSGRCRVCREWFTSIESAVTCSDECFEARRKSERSRHKAIRRARKTGAYVSDVSPRKVFEADGYRCHLCGKKTDPRKKVPHPKAPTVDHVMPLAAGGTHEPVNCRTACFLCNSIKSNRGGGEQMLLLQLA